MKHTGKKLFCLSVAFLGLVTSSCGETLPDLTKNAPDFSSRERQFMTFGYSSTSDGKYRENGVEMSTGEDYRTVERFKEYKDAGLNTQMLQQSFAFWGGDWEKSTTKWMLDLCAPAGIDNCIITDGRIYSLSQKETPLVGEGCEYATQEDLVAYIRELMSPYLNHPNFYGLLIRDEPLHQMLPAWGAVYRAIKEIKPDAYIEANLLPYSSTEESRFRYCEDYKTSTATEAYDKYITKYLENSNAEKLLMDSYPFLVSGSSSTIKTEHLLGVEYLARTAKEKNLRFDAVAQTFGGTISGNEKWTSQNVATMNWQINAYLGFGVKTFGYFTYWRKGDNSNGNGGEWFSDGTSFITQRGERTSLYYTMQTLHKEMQAFAPTMYDFVYQGNKCLTFEPVPYDTRFFDDIPSNDFALLGDDAIQADEGSMLLATELKDPTSGQYMYMIMNAVNPLLKKNEYDDVSAHFTVNFGSEYNAAEVYYRGQKKLVHLKNGVYSGYLDAGYADYIMPYKA